MRRAGGTRASRQADCLRPPDFAKLPARQESTMAAIPYDTDLDRNPANFQPLTPLAFLQRCAEVFPDRAAR